MMKKGLSIFLAVTILVSLFSVTAAPASAAYTLPEIATVERIIKATGIMTGDQNGNMNLTRSVTRAEFAKLLVMASPHKDSVTGVSASSPFRDVRNTHWASGYIRTAVDEGWVTGYLDGTYRPENVILLEEAASAILKLLGYGPSDYIGAYPAAQISRFTSLGLATGLSAKQGSTLTRNDCMIIFYNLLSAKHKDGAVYGVLLGYPADSDGYFDYMTYTEGKLEGPFVLAAGSLSDAVPFDLRNAGIYRNGRVSTVIHGARYSVYYYNELTAEVWIYTDRVIGLLTYVSPNSVSPTAVIVGGNYYDLGTEDAKRRVSASGNFSAGDTVALLLGMNGEAVDIIDAGLVDVTYYGMATSIEMTTYSTGVGRSAMGYMATVACTDGIIRQFVLPGSTNVAGMAGRPVSVSYSEGVPEMKRLYASAAALSGTVNSSATRLGDYAFAEDVEIMEISDTGEWTILTPGRLSGAVLPRSNSWSSTQRNYVQFYLLNSRNEIAVLILRDVTGDMYSYGAITNVAEWNAGTATSTSLRGAYSYVIDGVPGVLNKDSHLRIKAGAGRFINDRDSGAIDSIKNLERVDLTSVSALQKTAVGGNKRYDISDSVQVYLNNNGNYHLTELSAVSDLTEYKLEGYYENEFPAGGQLRVIIANRIKNNSDFD